MATIAGTLTFEFLEDSQMLAVRGVITGLNASTTGGWHIHTGFTCDVASYVGGHYYLGGTPDSWKGITYTADSNGVADITTFLPGFSLAGGPLGVNGHSVVIHNSYYCSRQIQPMPPSLSCCTVTLRDALSHSVMHCHTPCCTVTLRAALSHSVTGHSVTLMLYCLLMSYAMGSLLLPSPPLLTTC